MVAISLTSTLKAIAVYPYDICTCIYKGRLYKYDFYYNIDFLVHIYRKDSNVTSVSYFHRLALQVQI